jgi:hypothetical protein
MGEVSSFQLKKICTVKVFFIYMTAKSQSELMCGETFFLTQPVPISSALKTTNIAKPFSNSS